MKRATAVNLFSRFGNVAKGLQDYIQTLLYTCSTEEYLRSVEEKIKKGEINNGKIQRFAYKIDPTSPNNTKADYVIALLTPFEKQMVETKIPNKDGIFTPDTLSDEYNYLKVQRTCLYDIEVAVAASEAKQVIIFFTYNPFCEKFNLADIGFLRNIRCYFKLGSARTLVIFHGYVQKRYYNQNIEIEKFIELDIDFPSFFKEKEEEDDDIPSELVKLCWGSIEHLNSLSEYEELSHRAIV